MIMADAKEQILTYITDKAAKYKARAAQEANPSAASDLKAGMTALFVVADDIRNDFHVPDEAPAK